MIAALSDCRCLVADDIRLLFAKIDMMIDSGCNSNDTEYRAAWYKLEALVALRSITCRCHTRNITIGPT